MPIDWTPTTLAELQDHLDAHGVRFFDADEVIKRHAGMPAADLWPNIIPTLRLLDAVRAHMDVPFTVTSGYRSPDYNARVGGATRSQHVRFSAVDIHVHNRTAPDVARAIRNVLGQAFVAAFCGLGVYPDANFVHFDTRGLTSDAPGASW